MCELPPETAKPITVDYDNFDVRLYLQEVFGITESGIDAEIDRNLAVMADIAVNLPGDDLVVLDFGCGPTIINVISLASKCREIHMADYASPSIQALDDWARETPEAHDWSPYIKRCLELERGTPAGDAVPPAEIAARQSKIRTTLTRLGTADIRKDPPLDKGRFGGYRYDAIVCMFCLETVAADVGDWEGLLSRLSTFLNPGGLLVLGTVRYLREFTGGTAPDRRPCLDKPDIDRGLINAGFDSSSIHHVEIAPTRIRRYDLGIMTTARLTEIWA